MTPTITPEQREALYDQTVDRLNGIGDIELAIKNGEDESAEILCREYSDQLRLLVDDLGFGESDGRPVELTSPPDVLRRVLPRLRELAEGQFTSHEAELAELRELNDRNRIVTEVCTTVLDELGR